MGAALRAILAFCRGLGREVTATLSSVTGAESVAHSPGLGSITRGRHSTPCPCPRAGPALVVLCFSLSLQAGIGMSSFQKAWMRGWSQWSLTRLWLPERNNLSIPWELILEQGELRRLPALFFSSGHYLAVGCTKHFSRCLTPTGKRMQHH